jgi:hypothetical protein
MGRLRAILLAFLALLIFAPASSLAASITFGLDTEFSGGVAPASGITPWVTATFDDSYGGPNTVRVTMSAPNLTGGQGGEAIGKFYFNFDPLLDPTQLTFTVVDNSASIPNSIGTGVNLFMADGDGNFDIVFNFPQPPGIGSERFTEGESIIYDLTYTSAIDVSSFEYFSEMGGGQGAFLTAAQVQRTGGGTESGWIGAVPEPSTALLLASGLLLLGARRRSVRHR